MDKLCFLSGCEDGGNGSWVGWGGCGVGGGSYSKFGVWMAKTVILVETVAVQADEGSNWWPW